MNETQTCHKCMSSDIHIAATRCPHCRALLGDKVPWSYRLAGLVVAWLVLCGILYVVF